MLADGKAVKLIIKRGASPRGAGAGSEPQWREDPSQGRKSSWSGKDVLPETTRGRDSVCEG